MVNKLLRKYLIENFSDGILAYHGSKTKFDSFSDEFVGNEGATDEEGPGIYFTTDYSDAASYGKEVYSVKLTGHYIGDGDPHIIDIEKLIRLGDEWEMSAQNYSEDPEHGLEEFINSAYKYNETESEVLQQVWVEFYRHEPLHFVRNCVKIGIDGVVVNRYRDSGNEGKHVIVYNPKTIELLKKNK